MRLSLGRWFVGERKGYWVGESQRVFGPYVSIPQGESGIFATGN